MTEEAPRNFLANRFFFSKGERASDEYDQYWIRYKPMRVLRKRLKSDPRIDSCAKVLLVLALVLSFAFGGILAVLAVICSVLGAVMFFRLRLFLFPTHIALTEDGITFLSKADIAAMKLLAISNSGQRIKDFMDIYFLLEHYSISDMLGFFSVKYPSYNTIIPFKAISYFDDLNPAMDPPLPVKPVSVKELKARITDAVLHSKKTY